MDSTEQIKNEVCKAVSSSLWIGFSMGFAAGLIITFIVLLIII